MMTTPKRILVATDFGEAAGAALAFARELARTFDARLEVLHVLEDVCARLAAEGFVSVNPDLQQQFERRARQRLDALLKDEDAVAPVAHAAILAANGRAMAIAAYARYAQSDLIVMGQGRGLAERVTRNAPCSVLAVRPPGRESVQPNRLAAAASA